MKGNPMNANKRTALRTGTAYAPTSAEERAAWCGRPDRFAYLDAIAARARPVERRPAFAGARIAFDLGAALAAFLALAFMVLAIVERAPIRADWQCLARGYTTSALVEVECK